MASKPKLESVQVLRAIAAILVVVHHQVDVEARYGRGHPLLTGFIGGFGVDIFFVISGFVMFYVGAHKAAGLESAKRFMLARVARIAPLYWFYTLLFAGMVLLFQKFFRTSDPIDLMRVIKSLFFWPQDGALPLIHQGWTLNYEMLFYLLFSLSLFFLSKRRVPILIVALLCLVSIGTLLPDGQHKAVVVATSPLLIEFILGMLIGRLFISAFIIPYPVALIGGVAGFAALFAFSSACRYDSDLSQRFLMWGLPSAAIVLAATQMERSRSMNLPWLAAVGDASYSLYLSHTFVLPVVGRLWNKYGIASSVVFLGVVLGACLLVAFMSYRWIERPAIRWTTMLFDRRSTRPVDKSIATAAPVIVRS
jgi:exopolysaccharide production protein ExoZ